MILLVEYFKSPNPQRDSEYLFCINQNIMNTQIKEICVFISDESELIIKHPKIKVIKRDTRPTFYDLLVFSNENYPNQVCSISNTDIFFDQSISVIKDFDFSDKFLALTRWDIFNQNGDWFIRYYDNPWFECYLSDGTIDESESINTSDLSQDSWIYQTPVRVDERTKFLMGKPGCDNRIAQLFHELGYDVRNPSKLIKILHYHQTNFRTYTNAEVIPGPYLLIKATEDIYIKPKIKTIPNFQIIRNK